MTVLEEDTCSAKRECYEARRRTTYPKLYYWLVDIILMVTQDKCENRKEGGRKSKTMERRSEKVKEADGRTEYFGRCLSAICCRRAFDA